MGESDCGCNEAPTAERGGFSPGAVDTGATERVRALARRRAEVLWPKNFPFSPYAPSLSLRATRADVIASINSVTIKAAAPTSPASGGAGAVQMSSSETACNGMSSSVALAVADEFSRIFLPKDATIHCYVSIVASAEGDEVGCCWYASCFAFGTEGITEAVRDSGVPGLDYPRYGELGVAIWYSFEVPGSCGPKGGGGDDAPGDGGGGSGGATSNDCTVWDEIFASMDSPCWRSGTGAVISEATAAAEAWDAQEEASPNPG